MLRGIGFGGAAACRCLCSSYSMRYCTLFRWKKAQSVRRREIRRMINDSRLTPNRFAMEAISSSVHSCERPWLETTGSWRRTSRGMSDAAATALQNNSMAGCAAGFEISMSKSETPLCCRRTCANSWSKEKSLRVGGSLRLITTTGRSG